MTNARTPFYNPRNGRRHKYLTAKIPAASALERFSSTRSAHHGRAAMDGTAFVMSGNIYYRQSSARGLGNVSLTCFLGVSLCAFATATVILLMHRQAVWAVVTGLMSLLGLWHFAIGVIAIIRNEKREIGIDSDVIWWKFPRWPKSEGRMRLEDVHVLTLEDASCEGLAETHDGQSTTIPFVGSAMDLGKVVGKRHPHILTKVKLERGLFVTCRDSYCLCYRGLARRPAVLFFTCLAGGCFCVYATATVIVLMHQRGLKDVAGALVGMWLSMGALYYFAAGVVAFVRNEKWEIGIENDLIWWKSPRWPKSEGSIRVEEINVVALSDETTNGLAETRDGQSITIPHLENIAWFLRDRYPHIKVRRM